MLRDRVEILRKVQTAGKIGKNSGSVAFESLGTVWANVGFNRGIKAVREAALDGVDYVIVRMRYNENKDKVNRNSYLYHDGVMYMILEFKHDGHDNIIQIKAQETTDKRVIAPAPTPNENQNDNENSNQV